jgi:long-chain acyl-CoA synthetase
MKKDIEIINSNGRRTVKGLGCHRPRTVMDIKELVRNSAERYGDKPAFKMKDREGRIISKTYTELASDVDRLGTALLSLGLKDLKISIIGENRYEWAVCYLAIINGTGIAVPLDRHLPQNEVENLIARGRVEVMFYSPAYHEMMLDIADKNPCMKYFICMGKSAAKTADDPRFITLPDLMENGGKLLGDGDRSFTDAVIDREKMTVLLFTSGTTSMSKGVMLSHANLAANVTSITAIIKVYPTDTHLSLLPYHHTFENTVGLLFMLHSGICIAYSDGIKHIARNLKEYNVTILVAVPAIFEAMYRKLQEGIRKSGKEKLLNAMIKLSDVLRAVGIDLRRKLFRSVFAQLGPGLRVAVSGAAALDKEVVTGFEKIGFRLLQGYGMTEASPVIATNNDFVNVPGTIGHPIYGVEATIDAPDENGIGEIIAKGGNIMLGYYDDPAATADSFTEDGWLRTGDIGYIDEKGLIRITGRAKSMIVLNNGKKAFPEEYEVQLNNIPGVKESFVWGNTAPDGDVQICAKLVVDKDNAGDGKGGLLPERELAARFDAAIKEINKTVPQYKVIRYFVMSEEELVKANGIKAKRHIEQEKVRSMLAKADVEIRKVSGRFIERI